MTRELTINLGDILEEKYPNGFHVPANIDVSMLLEYGDDDWSHSLNLDAVLEAENKVALIWSVDDVLARRPDLDEEQAWKVLVTARDDFLKDKCHLDFIESTANGLYPVGGLAQTLLVRRVEALLKSVAALPETNLSLPDQVAGIASRLDELEQSIAKAGGQP